MVAPRHLKSLQAIELALRTGSLKGAASELGITPAAAGQRIKALEDLLGVDLMMRGRSGLVPSPALAQAMEHLGTAFSELERAAELLELQRTQQLRIRAAPDLAELWLAPRLDRFAAEFPNLRLVLSKPAEGTAADCEIGFGYDSTDEFCDVLFHDRIEPLGSPDIARRVALLPTEAPLAGFPLIRHDFYAAEPGFGDWQSWGAAQRIAVTSIIGMRFASMASAVDAARAGAGVILAGLALVRSEFEQGRLVRTLDPAVGQVAVRPLVARFRPASLARPQTRRFRQWLQDEAADTRMWLNESAAAPAPPAASPRSSSPPPSAGRAHPDS